MENIFNTLTGEIYYGQLIGTEDEKSFFKVMLLNGGKKLFFEHVREYHEWASRKENKTFLIPGYNGNSFK